MQVVYPRCAALDLGKDILVAAVRVQDAGGVTCECRTYGTTANQLSTLRGWLVSHGVTHVVMEATGSYWKSVWRALEGHFELTLANPRQIRSLPGRKSDVKDARRIVDFHAHGLIQGSFVPPAEIDALRELTRTRKQFVREVNRHTQRIQKILDVANVKITGLITDTLGVSGRAILKALIAGQTDPERLAALALPRLRARRAQLVEALQGQPTEQQRSLLGMHLQLIETLETSIARLDDQSAKAVEPFRELVARLGHVPGLSDKVSIPALLGEIGVDMTKFPTHRNLISWACLCSRNDESAGKVRSRRTLKGAVWVKTLMIQVAWTAVRTKNSYFRAQFYRLCRTTGDRRKAIVAVAASILTVVYHMIREGTPYTDLGVNYFDERNRAGAARRLVARLQNLGYNVQVTEAVA
jgi:transposase